MKSPFLNVYRKLRPIFFLGEPEKMHSRMLSSIETLSNFPIFLKFLDSQFKNEYNILQTNIFQKTIHNPIGLAAGFDKDGRIFNTLFRIGFGFVEIGTVTPLPQIGNKKPRLYRLVSDQALINCLGFNNRGVLEMSKKLKNFKNRINPLETNKKNSNVSTGMLGINIGKNKNTPIGEASKDYVNAIETLYPFADYFTLNISSPNTEDLRKLQKSNFLEILLKEVCICRDKLDNEHFLKTPILIKLSPDLSNDELCETIMVIKDFSIQGVIATNTSNELTELKSTNQNKNGGLSGKPLQKRSTKVIGMLFNKLGDKFTIIGVGGVFSGADAYEKIRAGASAIQLYTSLIYEGPALVKKVKKELAKLLDDDGFKNVSEAVGIDN